MLDGEAYTVLPLPVRVAWRYVEGLTRSIVSRLTIYTNLTTSFLFVKTKGEGLLSGLPIPPI
jgi:hypothetical protein